MIRLAELIETFLPDLEQKYGSRLLPRHRQDLTAIQQCHAQALGTTTIHCQDCDCSGLIETDTLIGGTSTIVRRTAWHNREGHFSQSSSCG